MQLTIRLTMTLFLVSTISVRATNYDITEVGGTLTLPNSWGPIDASLVKAQNDEMIRLRPSTPTRYIAGFVFGNDSSHYIWIQRTPMSNPPMTPEQLVDILPRELLKAKPEFERLLKDTVSSIDPGVAYYDERLGAVVWDNVRTLSDATVEQVRSYLIVTKVSVISVSAYSKPDSARTLFEEVLGIVSTLKLKQDQKMSQPWIDRLKELLRASHR